MGQRDYEVLGRSAHSVKSSSQSLGTLVLGRAAEALELLANAKGSFQEAERLLAAMRAAFDAAKSRLIEVATAAAVRLPNARADDHQMGMFVKPVALAG
jgi:HPt (histidine-containing phosphotransfer) domain-containing protein